MRLRLQRLSVMVLGAFLGYVVYCAFGNCENWSFYTFRSTVTGETVMSRIVDHPADWWVCLAAFLTPVCIGATTAVVILEGARRQWTRRPE